MSDIKKTPRELECKKKYLYEHSMFWECNEGSKCQILEDDVCDLLNKLYEENERLRNQLERLLNFLESFRYKSNIDGNYAKFNFITPLGNDGIEIEIKRKTESYKHRSLDEYD